MKVVLESMTRHRMQLVEIHNSDHAGIRTLQRVVSELRPRKIVPVHTFQPDRFHI
jgi:ribonuclease J